MQPSINWGVSFVLIYPFLFVHGFGGWKRTTLPVISQEHHHWDTSSLSRLPLFFGGGLFSLKWIHGYPMVMIKESTHYTPWNEASEFTPENMPSPNWKVCLPTIHFQGLLLLVFGSIRWGLPKPWLTVGSHNPLIRMKGSLSTFIIHCSSF